MKSITNRASENKRRQASTLPNLTAYSAVQAKFREWLQTEYIRASAAYERIEDELSCIRYRVRNEADRLNLSETFDFDSCGIDEETAGLFKRYMALNVALDREMHRAGIVEDALKGTKEGDVNAAYHVFISCYDDEHNDLHRAMIEEMFACSS